MAQDQLFIIATIATIAIIATIATIATIAIIAIIATITTIAIIVRRTSTIVVITIKKIEQKFFIVFNF